MILESVNEGKNLTCGGCRKLFRLGDVEPEGKRDSENTVKCSVIRLWPGCVNDEGKLRQKW